jgi:SAM-dependent methyltransferase
MDVLATDAPPDIVEASWARGKQYTSDIDALYKPQLLPRHAFDRHVQFRHADMNAIPEDITGYDGCWSACALEHLGSLQHGLDFIRNSLNVLRPGGVAVHTTEFNLASDNETFEHPRASLYRKRDIVGLLRALRDEGHDVWPLNLHPGDTLLDEVIDLPPYSPVHLKLALRRFISTSIGIVVRRAEAPG